MDGKSNGNGQAFDEELRKMVVNRTLVTGGAGFIGSHICDSLLEMGDEVVCIDDLSTGSMKISPTSRIIQNSGSWIST